MLQICVMQRVLEAMTRCHILRDTSVMQQLSPCTHICRMKRIKIMLMFHSSYPNLSTLIVVQKLRPV